MAIHVSTFLHESAWYQLERTQLLDNPTENVNTQAEHYSPTEYIDGTPPILKDIFKLFFKPKDFFTSEIAVGKTPYIFYLLC